MSSKDKSVFNIPLIVEKHPENYVGYPFITLIQYRKSHVLSIIDNSNNTTIKSYVLDLCGPERVNEERIIEVTKEWYDNARTIYPISVEFSKRGLTSETGRIYRAFNIEFVTRVIGPLPKFEMSTSYKVRRRKKKALPQNIEVIKKVVFLPTTKK